ncbi:hypothetical protein BH11PLA1_BH11PLA1_02460 [soil metagenome]
MPPLPRIQTPWLRDLAFELRFAPRAAARRQVERAEALSAALDAATEYPEDFVIFKITGARPQAAGARTIGGARLRRELPALVHRLGVNAAFTAGELEEAGWVSVRALAAKMKRSMRWMQRAQRAGVLTRRARAAVRGGWIVMVRPEAVEGWRSVAAKSRAGRTVGAFRRGAHGAIDPAAQWERRLIWRAFARGVPAREIARRLKKSVSAVTRTWQVEMARRMRGALGEIDTDVHIGPRQRRGRAPAPEAALGVVEVRGGLGRGGAPTLISHIAETLARGWPDAKRERALALAYGALVARARGIVAGLDRGRPASLALDDAATDLRWAARLKVELVRDQQMLLLKTAEAQVGAALQDLPREDAHELFALLMSALAEGVERFDPTRAGRLAAPAGIELNRAAAKWLAARKGGALRRGIAFADWTRGVAPWQDELEPDPRLRAAVDDGDADLSDADRALLRARFGWEGEPPTSLRELAQRAKVPANQVSRRTYRALAAGLRAARNRRSGKGQSLRNER